MNLFALIVLGFLVGGLVGWLLWKYTLETSIKPLEKKAAVAELNGYLKGVNETYLILNENILSAFENNPIQGPVEGYKVLKEIMIKNEDFIKKVFPNVKFESKVMDVFGSIEAGLHPNGTKNGLLN